MKKRIISLLMCLVMTFSLLPTAAWAELAPAQGEEQPSARTETAQAAAAAPQAAKAPWPSRPAPLWPKSATRNMPRWKLRSKLRFQWGIP